MASAKLENYDYVLSGGSLEMTSGISEELQAQDFELGTNHNEWWLGSKFGYPWFVSDSDGNNIGLLGTRFDAEKAAAIFSTKILKSSSVQSIQSISFELDKNNRFLGCDITELLIPGLSDEDSVKGFYTLAFKYGG
jgi:hypothetical protein